ncbi:MAG: hypothetical protein ACYCW6_06810 [Candidatus Xenobia bacterium]
MASNGRLLLAMACALAFSSTPAFADDAPGDTVGLITHPAGSAGPAQQLPADRFTADFTRLSAGQTVDLSYPKASPAPAVIELTTPHHLQPVASPVAAPPLVQLPPRLQKLLNTATRTAAKLRALQQRLQPRIKIGGTTVWVVPMGWH